MSRQRHEKCNFNDPPLHGSPPSRSQHLKLHVEANLNSKISRTDASRLALLMIVMRRTQVILLAFANSIDLQ